MVRAPTVYPARRVAGFVRPSLLGQTDFRAVRAPESPGRSTPDHNHKTHQPDVLVYSFDADALSSEDRAEIDFSLAQTDPAATRDHDDLIVERIVDVRQSGVDAGEG